MPRSQPVIPAYRLHKPSGQAVVRLNGEDVYLGIHGTEASKRDYNRITGEWLAAGRQRPQETPDITVVELCAAFWSWAKEYYKRPTGRTSGEVGCQKAAVTLLKRCYGSIAVDKFGPLSLQALQGEMIKLDYCRKYINAQTQRIRRIFDWGVSRELVRPEVHKALESVKGLRKGKTAARESAAVRPVPEAAIGPVIERVSRQVAALINLQLLTGMRPGEAVIMRGCDIDTGAEHITADKRKIPVWIYRPQYHKTDWHDIARDVWIGPAAQKVLAPFLKRDVNAFIFSPIDAEKERYAGCGKHRRPKQKPNRRKTARKLRDRYDVDSYRRAIARACDLAFPHPELSALRPASLTDEQREQLRTWQARHRWHPHQLRHNAGTRLRAQFGIETAQTILGHSSVAMTEVYAERDTAKAIAAAAEAG